MRRAIGLLIAVSLVSGPLLAMEGEGHRPFSEMQGDCSHFQMPLAHEFEVWKQPAVQSQAALSSEKIEGVPVGKRVDLRLKKESEISFLKTPEKSFPAANERFGGLSRFQTTAVESYRVALGSKVWLDIVDEETRLPVQSNRFEMQTHCQSIFKVIEYHLKPRHSYVVQLSSSAQPKAALMISAVGQNPGGLK